MEASPHAAVHGHADFVIALVCFVLLVSWRLPPLVVVALGAAAGVVVPAPGGGSLVRPPAGADQGRWFVWTTPGAVPTLLTS
jgi:hypothetical protein